MAGPDLIDLAFQKAEQVLNSAKGDMGTVSTPIATFLRVISAQGYLDNGGYRYFFEGDWWPGNPSYGDFAFAYHDIGCHAQALDLMRVVDTFPFAEPHLHLEQRNRYMDQNYDQEALGVAGWGDALCGDESIWENLKAFVLRHAMEFGV